MMNNKMILTLLMLSACSTEPNHVGASAVAASTTVSRLHYTAEQKRLLVEAEKGNAQAQFFLAQSLFETADPARIKESDFYYWMKKAADNGDAQAQEILGDMEADAMTPQEAEDSLAPNGSQKIMDEIGQLEKQTPIDYPLILKRLQQAAELQNYIALSDLTVIYGSPENASRYGIQVNAKTACILALYNNHVHGDLNKGHLDIYCNGERVSKQEWKQAEQFASNLSQQPKRIRELW